jgi:hypothetical protein
MVVFVGNQDADGNSSVLDSLRELLPVVGLLAMASLLVQWVVTLSTGASAPGELPRFGQDLAGPAGVALPALPPGLVFLLGGLLVLGGIAVLRRYRE